jgi:hypothetical protein
MKPKEKAKELTYRFYRIIPLDKMTIDYNLAKKCALIAVDEILNVIEDEREGFNWKSYYLEVKQEIEKL